MSKGKILIVDDEAEIRDSMADLLDLKSYDIATASNGVEGLKICAEQKVDLIILDLNMPRMDGYMFLEKLNERWEKDRRTEAFPKVLVMTAVAKKVDMGLATNLGASQVMSKPFKSHDFISAVDALMGAE